MRTNKLVDLYKCVYNNPRDTSLCLHSIISGKMGKIARGLEIFGSVSFYLVECQSAVESKRELSLEEISIWIGSIWRREMKRSLSKSGVSKGRYWTVLDGFDRPFSTYDCHFSSSAIPPRNDWKYFNNFETSNESKMIDLEKLHEEGQHRSVKNPQVPTLSWPKTRPK